jgi:hypothetical protein
MSPRSMVEVKLALKYDVEADLIEIHFKDTYLTRADMWRISSSLIGQCLYSCQRVSYYDVFRASVKNIYREGHKTFSAYIGASTKFVFRSEAARMIYFIQMSSEMWNFVENGEVMFHKLVNSFLPEVFKRWREQGAHHVVSIVLFTSVDVSRRKSRLGQGERETETKDYFRVVVDQVHISRWSDIMATLRYEFARFAKDVLQTEAGEINGSILPAVKGNLLEAISFATSLISSKFADRDLRRTGIQVLIVTPGTGIYDVDYDLFYQTSIKLLSIEIGIDLVCLSRPPLHVTPLFRYRTKTGQVVNCIPSWLDISFWNSAEQYAKQWIPRCKIYDIQMMGIMENEVNAISVDMLQPPLDKPLTKFMKDYDANTYLSKSAIASQRLIEEAASANTPSALLRPRVSATDLTKASGAMQSLRSVSKSIPATAIISSPTAEAGSSALRLSSTIKARPKVSGLTSLFSLGKVKGLSSPSSPSLQPSAPPDKISSLSPLDGGDLRERLDSMSSGTLTVDSTSIPSTSPSHGGRPSLGTRQSSYNRSKGRYRLKPSTSPQAPSGYAAPKELVGIDDGNNHIWVTIANPSNIHADAIYNISNYGRWRNVFPIGVRRRAVKWRSLKSPAALPLATEIFPSVEEFAKNYTFQIYDVTLDSDKEDRMTPGDLMEEMVALRLHIGFQIVVGDRVSKVEAQRRPGGNPALIVQTIPQDYHGIRIYMSRSNQIHRLAIDHYGTINVQLYTRTETEEHMVSRTYHPFVKTRFEDEYKTALGNFFDPGVRIVNWNLLDQALAGWGDVMQDSSKLFKVRFVIIPTDSSASKTTAQTSWEGHMEKLTAEEMRLEGLRKIITTLHRGSYMTNDEKMMKRNRKKEIIPPEIKFYTGDLGSFLLQVFEESTDDPQRRRASLFVKAGERLNRSIKLSQLAIEMQGDKGVRFVDRRWHWKTHKNCFIGQELVSWMIESFTDIDTSEMAVDYGNALMKHGLFRHVEDRHSFLNGHYFYQLNSEYVVASASVASEKPSWFAKRSASSNTTAASSVNVGTQSISESTPTTPITSSNSSAYIKGAYTHGRKSSGGVSFDEVKDSSSMRSEATGVSGSGVSEATERPRPADPLPKILLSQVLKYDVEPTGGRSKRPEFLSVHIDRVHNPENAFHLQMEWMNTTSKLIEEAVVNLSRQSDRYGLRLVQVPMEEISTLPNDNPFVSLVRVQIVLDPLTLDPADNSPENPLSDDPLYYHKYFLHHNGFVLDTVPASSLMKKEVEIQYSWGKPFYNYGQYIHNSGTVLAQIVADNSFILMINALHVSRIGVQTGSGFQSVVANPEEVLSKVKSESQDKEALQSIFSVAKSIWEIRRRGSSRDVDAKSDISARSAPPDGGRE